jgi:hypothetical protein
LQQALSQVSSLLTTVTFFMSISVVFCADSVLFFIGHEPSLQQFGSSQHESFAAASPFFIGQMPSLQQQSIVALLRDESFVFANANAATASPKTSMTEIASKILFFMFIFLTNLEIASEFAKPFSGLTLKTRKRHLSKF